MIPHHYLFKYNKLHMPRCLGSSSESNESTPRSVPDEHDEATANYEEPYLDQYR